MLGRSTDNNLLYSSTDMHISELFPFSVLEYKIITPAGTVRANSIVNADIYYSIPYSQGIYISLILGTLGILATVTVRLVTLQHFISAKFIPCSSTELTDKVIQHLEPKDIKQKHNQATNIKALVHNGKATLVLGQASMIPRHQHSVERCSEARCYSILQSKQELSIQMPIADFNSFCGFNLLNFIYDEDFYIFPLHELQAIASKLQGNFNCNS